MGEILAPCGSFETLEAALRSGCDAVYLGGNSFSARQNAKNFSDDELKEAVKLCHKRGVKIYQAINTVIFDSQLEECLKAVEFACKIGIDALITQDLSLIEIVKKCCPQMEIHASTQMTIHTKNGVEMSEELGFSRAVLSRELPLKTIDELSHLGTETEVFVHGALCMSVSGQCYMSGVFGGRSANRGLCAQACRLPFSANKNKEEHILSLKDMSYISSLSQLEKCGVTSFKIEGRMKRPEYVAMSTDCCKKSLEGKEFDTDILKNVFSRGGFTDGYLWGNTGKNMFGTRNSEDAENAKKAFPKIHEIYRREEKRDTVSFRFTAKENEKIHLEISDTKGNSAVVYGKIPQKAEKNPTDKSRIEAQLSKLGDCIYSFGKAEIFLDDGLWISPKEINSLRRRACEELDEKRTEPNSRVVEFHRENLEMPKEISHRKKPEIRIVVNDLSQLENVSPEEIEFAFIPLNQAEKCQKISEKFGSEKLGIYMPRFTFDEKSQNEKLKKAKEKGIRHILATNIAHIKSGRNYGMVIHTDFGFNLTNSLALKKISELDVCDSVVSFELKSGQINNLKSPLPMGIFAYGRLPLMVTANCPVGDCKKCKGKIFDRTGREFLVKCPKIYGYAEILNSDILYIPHKLEKFRNPDFINLYFYEENTLKVSEILHSYKSYKENISAKPRNSTGGLYFRGVL